MTINEAQVILSRLIELKREIELHNQYISSYVQSGKPLDQLGQMTINRNNLANQYFREVDYFADDLKKALTVSTGVK